ncbi:MAG: SurA N-terminal domain-containing protein [Tannerella sp.]|jgi:peptidyl-prolyl cis-trans isomerase D|nr:SurA N-terminal domain-containing protein [Tannerella sp.]
MATLEKIRNQAGLLVVIVGLALFAFIIGDFLNSGSTYMRQSQDQVANVNGKAIHYQEYMERIEEMSKIYRMQMNSGNLTEEQTTQIRQNVYDGLVNEIVLYGALEKLGITVTPEELFDMVQGENISSFVQQFPLFTDPETGVFNKMRALNVLKTIENHQNYPPEQRAEIEQIRDYWLFWERNLKIQTLQTKYMDLMAKAIVANPLEAKDAFESSLESSDMIYTMQAFATIPDSAVNVSENDIKKLYNQRREQFKQKETGIFDFIAVDIRPSQDDYEKVQADATKIMEEMATTDHIEDIVNASSDVPFLDAFVSANGLDTDMKAFVETAAIGEIQGPLFREDSYRIFKYMEKTIACDSVNVSHILLADQSGATTKETLEAMADSLVGVLKAGGNFEALAAQYSVDQSGRMGGTIGWLTETEALRYFGDDFKKTVFSASLNQPIIMVAAYGVHILKVTEKTANVPKYKIAYVHLSVTPSSRTYSNLYNELNQFISINNTIEKMETAVTDAGYVLNANQRVTATDQFVGAVTDSRPVVRWIFESKKQGEISKIFECRNHFIVAARRGIVKEGYQSLQSVTPILKNELAAKLKGETIAKELIAKNLRVIEAYSEAMNKQIDTVRYVDFTTQRITGIGMEPVLNASVVLAPLNEVSKPVVGNNGVYVFSVFNRNKNTNEYDAQSEISKLESAISYRAGYVAFQSLMDKAEIMDNRIRFE